MGFKQLILTYQLTKLNELKYFIQNNSEKVTYKIKRFSSTFRGFMVRDCIYLKLSKIKTRDNTIQKSERADVCIKACILLKSMYFYQTIKTEL